MRTGGARAVSARSKPGGAAPRRRQPGVHEQMRSREDGQASIEVVGILTYNPGRTSPGR